MGQTLSYLCSDTNIGGAMQLESAATTRPLKSQKIMTETEIKNLQDKWTLTLGASYQSDDKSYAQIPKNFEEADFSHSTEKS